MIANQRQIPPDQNPKPFISRRWAMVITCVAGIATVAAVSIPVSNWLKNREIAERRNTKFLMTLHPHQQVDVALERKVPYDVTLGGQRFIGIFDAAGRNIVIRCLDTQSSNKPEIVSKDLLQSQPNHYAMRIKRGDCRAALG